MVLFLGLFILLSFVIFPGCGAPDAEPPPPDDAEVEDEEAVEEEFKTLVFGLHGIPVTFDPANHRSRHVTSVVIHWTDGLTMSHPDGRQLPSVAESITQIDPVTYEIKIREGITFHNGDPVTADDVVFSYKRLFEEGGMEGETSPRQGLFGQLESVEKIDDYTVQANFKTEDPTAESRWIFGKIMPKNYFEEVGAEAYIQNPVGCGPFKFVEGDLSTQVVLERYEDYWGGNPEYPGDVDRVPAVDRLIIKFIPEATTRVAALLAGEVDIIQRVPLDNIPILEANPDINVVSGPGTRLVRIALNTTRPPFDNVLVRRAVAHAIDYDALVQQLYLGYSHVSAGVPNLPPVGGSSFEEYHFKLEPFEYDPERAKALLAEAGATDITLVLDTIPEFVNQAQAVAQMLTDVGIETSVRVWEEPVIIELMRTAPLQRDAYFYAIGNSLRDPSSLFEWAYTGEPLNYSHYSNPAFDELIISARALSESQERDELLFEAHQLLMEDLPFIQLHVPELVEATRSNVVNYMPHFQDRTYLLHVDKK